MSKTTKIELNVARGTFGPMPCYDDVHRNPAQWIKTNAHRFHFTDAQIIRESRHQFDGQWSSYGQIWGIYFLVDDNQIVYVGLSNHIARRICQHRDKGKPFSSVSWFEAPNEYLQEIEAYYINRISPPLNFSSPAWADGDFVSHARLLDLAAGINN